MATANAERALVDTSVLVDATDVKRPGHRVALSMLESRQGLVISAQIAREYLVLATRPTSVNGLGLDLADALSNLSELRRAAPLLAESKPLLPTLIRLLKQVPCQGKVIHDALLVATMQVHRLRTLITSNATDFERFDHLIDIIEPAEALS